MTAYVFTATRFTHSKFRVRNFPKISKSQEFDFEPNTQNFSKILLYEFISRYNILVFERYLLSVDTCTFVEALWTWASLLTQIAANTAFTN